MSALSPPSSSAGRLSTRFSQCCIESMKPPNSTVAGAPGTESEGRRERMFSRDFTLLRVKLLGSGIKLLSGHSGANGGQHHLRVPVTDEG